MIESEFKVMLTQEQYSKIHSMFQWDSELEQTNFYYDTQELVLSGRHITCRVRRIGEQHFFQMKLPTEVALSRVELEQALGEVLPKALSAAMLNSLSGRDDLPDVSLLGGLKTFRSVKKLAGAEIDLDKSEYFGKTDYELEIEFTDEQTAERLLDEICTAAGLVPHSNICLGKIHRFLKEYKSS